MRYSFKRLTPSLFGFVAAFCCTARVHAAPFAFTDSFSGPTLSSAWTVSPYDQAPATNYWTTSMAGGKLIIHDIVDTVANNGWAGVRLRSDVTPLTDFSAALTFSWDAADVPGAQWRAMQQVSLVLRNTVGDVMASVGLTDAWVDHPGDDFASIGESNIFSSIPHDQPYTGSFLVQLERTGPAMIARLNSNPILTVPSTNLGELASVSIEVQHFLGWHSRSPGQPSFFGTVSIDNFSLSGTTVPEPSSLLLVLTGGLLLMRRRLARVRSAAIL